MEGSARLFASAAVQQVKKDNGMPYFMVNGFQDRGTDMSTSTDQDFKYYDPLKTAHLTDFLWRKLLFKDYRNQSFSL
eukprot:3459018-Amphidinium_carterae.1